MAYLQTDLIYLILNSYFFSENDESLIKSIGFLRFIIMAYAISYYYKKFDKSFLRLWLLFFLIVSADLMIEFFFGKNILGYESLYPGRLAGFSGEELKIGGFYFGFIFLSLSLLINKRNYLFIFKPSGETSIYSIQCSVDGLMIVDYYFPDDTQIATAINTCLPYLQPGYQSPDPYNRFDSSPYIKAENSSFSFNEYDLLRETERMHQEVMQKYGLIEEPIIEQDKQIPLKKKSKYLKPRL